MNRPRRNGLLSAIPLIVAAWIAGCTHAPSGNNAGTTGTAGATTLRIGYQKGGALNLVRLRGTLEPRLAHDNVTVQWLDFPAGPQLVEALGAGSIDLGLTGDSPPIFGQAGGTPLVYIANAPSAADGSSDGILVRSDSPLRSVADLRGKKVAFQRGSSAQFLVYQLLQKSGLSFSDIQPVYLSPPDARAAFESGAVDAWAIWDPFFAVARAAGHSRTLVDANHAPSAGSFYLASPDFAHRRLDILHTALDEAQRTSTWALSDPAAAGKLLAPTLGVPAAVLEDVTRRGRGLGVRAITAGILDQQQKEADAFASIGLLPKKINVRDDTLTPADYAKLDVGAARPGKP